MELWIRSQDREKLVKCDDIVIRKLLFDETAKKKYDYSIVGYFDKETEYEILGFYKTKERALEVLDEIQTEISNYVGTMAQIVYEIPLEQEINNEKENF